MTAVSSASCTSDGACKGQCCPQKAKAGIAYGNDLAKKLLSKGSVKYPTLMTKEEIAVDAPCLYDDVDSAVTACVEAQRVFVETCARSKRAEIVAEIRRVAHDLAEDFALWAISETGRGRYEDKVTKQNLAASKTPGVEDLQARVVTGDDGMTVIDYAPFGVIGAVSPVTNPTATIIHNSICMIVAGNGIVYNAHPAAQACTNRVIAIVNEIIKAAGGPESLVCSIKTPTIASGQALLTHAKTAANLVTGGPAVVKVALNAGKKCWCAGPGNPPVVVDETADITKAAADVYAGASFDNNMICSDEKEVFVVSSVADQFIDALQKAGAYLLNPSQVKQLEASVLKEPCAEFTHGVVIPALVGQPAQTLFKLAEPNGKIPDHCRLLIADVPEGHPFVHTELLMPVLPVVRMGSFEKAVDAARKAEHGYRHTSSIYSKDVNRITYMSRKTNTSIFCVNGNHLAGLASGGEGYTSFSITGFTGEGMTKPSTFVRERRYVYVGSFN